MELSSVLGFFDVSQSVLRLPCLESPRDIPGGYAEYQATHKIYNSN